MAKYIDAEALMNELEAGCMPIYWIGISGILGDKDCIRDYIERAPAADLQEVKHGEWSDEMISKNGYKIVETTTGSLVIPSKYTYVPDHQLGFQCSACGALMKNKTTYCGNCGAKMDGWER